MDAAARWKEEHVERKRNLLFLFTDEQRADTLECYGNTVVQAPNLNGLARRSFVFERPYVTQPVCTPARSSIMTGLYPHTNGCTENNIPLKPETKTIAEMVSPDYRCGYYGKWHLGDEVVPQHGFERWVSMEDTYRRWFTEGKYLERFSDYYHYLRSHGYEPDEEVGGAPVFSRPMAARLPTEHRKSIWLGREASRFIKENADRPFVLYVNFLDPHEYGETPDDLYPRDNLATGPAFLEKPAESASFLHRTRAEYYASAARHGNVRDPLDFSTEAAWREVRARYFGSVTLVDQGVGMILEALEESGQVDNTIVVFTSEHGDMLGDHYMLHKNTMYEESAKVPLIIHVPWLSKDQALLSGPVSQIDLVPTLLDLLGQPIPPELEGESLAPVLRGGRTLEGNDVVIQWNGPNNRTIGWDSGLLPRERLREICLAPGRTIVSGDGWKLNLVPGDRAELYDLNTDPYEMTNLFDDPTQRDRVRDLAARLQAWQERTCDTAPLPALG